VSKSQRGDWRPQLMRHPLGGSAWQAPESWVLVFMLACTAACGQSGSPDRPAAELFLTPAVYRTPVESKVYIGHIHIGGEGPALFVPCGRADRWFLGAPSDNEIPRNLKRIAGPKGLTITSGGATLLARVRGRAYGPVQLEINGEHYSTDFRLDEVLEARPHEGTDCESGSR
jgi:hypothetical protein